TRRPERLAAVQAPRVERAGGGQRLQLRGGQPCTTGKIGDTGEGRLLTGSDDPAGHLWPDVAHRVEPEPYGERSVTPVRRDRVRRAGHPLGAGEPRLAAPGETGGDDRPRRDHLEVGLGSGPGDVGTAHVDAVATGVADQRLRGVEA